MINFYLAQKICQFPDVQRPKLKTLAKTEDFVLLLSAPFISGIAIHAISPQKNCIVAVKTARIIAITYVACLIFRLLTLTFMRYVQPLQQQNSRLNHDLRRAREKAQRYKETKRAAEYRIGRAETNLRTARERANDLRQEKTDLEEHVNRQTHKIAELSKTIEVFQAKEEDLQRRESTQSELERSITVLNRKWNNRQKNCPTTVKQAQENIETLTRERDKLKEEVERRGRIIDSIVIQVEKHDIHVMFTPMGIFVI